MAKLDVAEAALFSADHSLGHNENEPERVNQSFTHLGIFQVEYMLIPLVFLHFLMQKETPSGVCYVQ